MKSWFSSQEHLIDFLIIFLLIFTPLTLGTVHNWSLTIFSIITVIIFNLYIFSLPPKPVSLPSKPVSLPSKPVSLPSKPVSLRGALFFFRLPKRVIARSPIFSRGDEAIFGNPPIVKWCIFFLIVAIFQLIPLPKAILTHLSPATYSLYQNYSLNYASPNALRSISIYSWATISDLVKIISYGLIFLTIVGRLQHRPPTYHSRLDLNLNLFNFLQLGCLTAILAILFHSFVDFNLHIPANAFYFTVILAFISTSVSPPNLNFARKIINAIIIIGFSISLFGIIQKFSAPGKIYWVIRKDGAPFGPYVNYDHYAGYMGMCASLAIASFIGHIRVSSFFSLKGVKNKILWFSSSEANKTILYLFFSMVMTASIFLCTSRGGILSFCLANILFFFLVLIKTRKNRLKRILFSVILAIIMIAIMVVWVGPEEWLNRFADLNRVIRVIIKEPSVLSELRPFLWKDTINIIKDFPALGTGLGTFCYIFPKYRTFALWHGFLRYAHNDYLQLIAEMGLFGLLFILVFLIFFIKKYIQTVRRLSTFG